MKNLIINIAAAALCVGCTENAQEKPQQREWENQSILQINREPARAAFTPYGTQQGDRSLSLNGDWKFNWTPTPDSQPENFYETNFSDAAWNTLAVPADWEMNGYGTPIYSSSGYTFKIDPPRVMGEPKESYTAYIERNPTGCYRRSFTIPSEWDGKELYLHFGSVASAFYVWINGAFVGYSQGSMEPAEFCITPYVCKGLNTIALKVLKYSDGSYLEDQDQWRVAGIHRDVNIYATERIRIRDFGVRTNINIDKNEATVVIAPEVSAAADIDGKGYTVSATIITPDGETIADSTLTADVETMLNKAHKAKIMNQRTPQRGYPMWGWMETTIENAKFWTAENPQLYTLRLSLIDSTGVTIENIDTRIGLRDIRIENGQLLVNGIPTRLRGVNRHEMDPRMGKVMTEELMRKDLILMKQANINAVRTCHYPNCERWYELCDSIGMYVMDEADIEEHGLRGQLASDPTWTAAWLDRTQRMAIRDRNHACVISWSLGNEAGWGVNFAASAAWLHEFDPTRFVHYEGAQGSRELLDGEKVHENDPAYVDVISRFYPRTQDEYLNPGITDGDMERPENARWERLLSIAKDTRDNRPVLTSEYAHAMGNALGNMREYWDEIYSNPRMLGGFIWEWADEGIEKRIESIDNGACPIVGNGEEGKVDTTYIAYGGDFGDKPNLNSFCIKGVVDSYRNVGAKYYEVKSVYAPMRFHYEGGKVRTEWLDKHVDINNYEITETRENGLVNVSAKLKSATKWAPAGFEVAKAQFVVDKNWWKSAADVKRDKVNNEPVTADEAIALFAHVKPHFYRAPLDNDRGFGSWIAKDWSKQRLDSLQETVVSDFATETLKDGSVKVSTTRAYATANGSIETAYVYIVMPDGSIDFKATYTPKGDLPTLPCLGTTLVLPKYFNELHYVGRGPWDNYPDRKESCHIGRYKSTVAEQYFHNPKPQDSGNHEDVAYVCLSNGRDHISVSAIDGTFSFSALPYSATQFATTKHDYELRAENYVYLNLDAAVLGIGNGSCGPGVLKKYAIEQKPHTLHVKLRIEN